MNKLKTKKQFKMLSSFSILFIIIAFLVVVSWVLYWANVTTLDASNEVIKIKAVGILDIFYAPIQGFVDKIQIIIFILILGAFIYLLTATKALEGLTQRILVKMKGKEIFAIIPLMIFFSICGTTVGLAEETIGFYMICIPLVMAAGFDVFTGVMIIMLGAGTGVVASTVNPFIITAAIDAINESTKLKMNIADGMVWRIISWILFTAIAIIYVMYYAAKVKKTPSKSITFPTYEGDKKFFLTNQTKEIKMDWRKNTSLIIFAIAFLFMILYLINWDSIFNFKVMANIEEFLKDKFPYFAGQTIPKFGSDQSGLIVLSMIFLISCLAIGAVNSLGEEKFLKEFFTGFSDLISVALIVATAAGVGYILNTSNMQLLFARLISQSIGGITSEVAKIIVLFILFIPLSFFIPSSSGFASAVFPLLGFSLINAQGTGFQTVAAPGSITAFSFANGLINLITPTSGVVMGAISIARMDYRKYLKGILPFIGIIFVFSLIMLALNGVVI